MFPWFLCLLSTPSDDLPGKSFPQIHPRTRVWWSPVESIPDANGYEIQEGDILVPMTASSNLKNAIKLKKYLWEGGRIPYEFGKNFSNFEKKQILDAMNVLEAKTCVKFVKNVENQETFVRFQKEENGCYAPIGRLTDVRGPLPVNLQSPECFKERGIIEHELLHVVGLFHEQSRPDRDDYVTIHWCNIQPHREIDFLKGNFNDLTTFGLPYDYGSIMHYPRWAFSRNGKPTITSKRTVHNGLENDIRADKGCEYENINNGSEYNTTNCFGKNVFRVEYAEGAQKTLRPLKVRNHANPDMILGQREGPSVTDFEKVLKMYNCKISQETEGNAGMESAEEKEHSEVEMRRK